MVSRHIQPSPEITVTAAESSDSTPTRTTMVTLPTPEFNPRPIIPKVRSGGGNPQCTHLTMTRIYGGDIRCQMCLRTGSFGWVYRCTQDREVLLEDEMERGIEVRSMKYSHTERPKLTNANRTEWTVSPTSSRELHQESEVPRRVQTDWPS
jgi:hypothetical protein